MRASLYVDGFNLYHPLCELGENHLKWLNLWALGELICQDRQHDLVSVTYCTAYQQNSTEQRVRHQKYIEALEYYGVDYILGHYVNAPMDNCWNCGVGGEKANEKQSDINLALSVLSDASEDKFDWAYIISADSDQTATARFLKAKYPKKKLVTVAPPNKKISTKIAKIADGKRKLIKDDIIKCVMPQVILRDDGGTPIRCPIEYQPPASAVAE